MIPKIISDQFEDLKKYEINTPLRLAKQNYVYCVTNTISGRKYIGSHTGFVNDNYLGSGVHLTKAISKYGKKCFAKTILWTGALEYLREMETFWCEYFNVANSNLFYNCTNKGTGYQFGKPNPKLSDFRKGCIPWNKGLTKETSESIRIAAEKLKGKPSGSFGKIGMGKGRVSPFKGTKMSSEQHLKCFGKKIRVICPYCGVESGSNNLNRHIKANHVGRETFKNTGSKRNIGISLKNE